MNTNTKASVNQASRKNFRFFLPDFINQEVEEISPLSIDDLLPLGQGNLEEIRRHHRRQEQKLAGAIKSELNATVKAFDLLESAYGLNVLVHLQNIEAPSKRGFQNDQLICNWKSHGENCLRCRFGHFAAMWCKMNPQTTFDCSPIMRPAEELRELMLQREYPFDDKPCLLMDDEELARFKEFLRTKAEEFSKRLSLVRQRIDCLTTAIDKAEKKPRFATFRDPENWFQIGETVIALNDQPTDVGSGFKKAMVADTKFNLPPLFRFDTILVLFPKNALTFQAFDPTILRPEEFDYLRENEDYLDLWLDWSLPYEVANTGFKDELKKHFVEGVG